MTIIASAGNNNEIGRRGALCWHIREDLLHFKELTMGGAVIMGRKTWESLPKKPLPGRLNIVVTRTPDFEAEGALTARSFPEAIEKGKEHDCFIIGGETLYREAMPTADRIELTRIYADDLDADAFFPEINPMEWEKIAESELFSSPEGLPYRFVTFERRAGARVES